MTFADSPSGCSAIGAATYNSTYKVEFLSIWLGGTIVLNNQSNTLCTIYYDINDTTIISYNSTTNTYTANASIFVYHPASFSIQNTTLMFNNPIEGQNYLFNKGKLRIVDATVTAVKPGYNTYIVNAGTNGQPLANQYSLYVDNSTFRYLGSNTASILTWGHMPVIYGVAGSTPSAPAIIKNSVFQDVEFGFMSLTSGAVPSGMVVVNNTFFNLNSTMNGNAGTIRLEADSTDFSHNIIYNAKGIGTAAVFLAEGPSNGIISYNTFHDNAGIQIKSKHSNNVTIKNNYFYNNWGAVISIYKGWVNASNLSQDLFEIGDTVENNIIKDYYDYGGTGVMQFQYYTTRRPGTHGTIFRNNTMSNINGSAVYLLGVRDLIFENNTFSNTTGGFLNSNAINYRGINSFIDNLTFRNNIYKETTGRFIYTNDLFGLDGTINNSVFIDEKYINYTGPYPWQVMYFKGGIIPGYINLMWNRNWGIAVVSPAMFYEYFYLDANVMDIDGNPVPRASVTVVNNVGGGYPAINILGKVKTSAVTGPDGHTPLPLDGDNSIAATYMKMGVGTQYMNHTLSAYDPFSIWTNVTHTIYPNGTIQQLQPLAQATVRPDASWYRQNPNTYQNTTTLQINYTRTNITVLPSLSQVNITVEKWNVSEVIAANFTADTAADNDVLFGIGNLKPNANYSIKKDGVTVNTLLSDSYGKLAFNNSVW